MCGCPLIKASRPGEQTGPRPCQLYFQGIVPLKDDDPVGRWRNLTAHSAHRPAGRGGPPEGLALNSWGQYSPQREPPDV